MIRHIVGKLTVFGVATGMAILGSQSTEADVTVFDSSFTNADGFTDGGINFGGANPDTIVGQAGFTLTDTAGAGILDGNTGSFNRMFFGWDLSDGFNQTFISGLQAGESIELAAFGLTFNPTAGFNANLGIFGLSDTDGANILGNSILGSGVQFTYDGSTIFLDRNPNFIASLDVNTNIASGEAFDYRQVMIANGDGTFDLEHLVNGSLLATTLGVTPGNVNNSGEDVGFLQDYGFAGGLTVDRLRLSFSVVPEPSGLAILSALAIGCAVRRRR